MKEKRKPSESYQQKPNLLTSTITFSKFKESDEVCMVYRILQSKGRKKAKYIIDAVKHYKACYCNDKDPYLLLEFIYPIKVCRAIKTTYEISSIEQLQYFLEGTNYEAIEQRLYKRGEAKTMLLGFHESDRDFYEYFNGLKMNERILLITNAVKAYYLDGADRDSKAWKMALDEATVQILKRYQASRDRAFLENIWALMECAKGMKGKWLTEELEVLSVREAEYQYKSTKEELKDLLIDVDDIDSVL